MKVSKGVRLSKEEAKMVDDFLRKNPFFDFSTLVRASLRQFLENPNINIVPVTTSRSKGKRRDEINA